MPDSLPADLGGRHGAATEAVATAGTATAGVAAARGSVAVAVAAAPTPEPEPERVRAPAAGRRAALASQIVAEQGLAQMGETWHAGGASAAVITRDPLPSGAFAPPEPATAAETTQWVEGLELVRMHNPQAALGVVLGVLSVLLAPVVVALLPNLPVALPSVAGLAALGFGGAGVMRGRWSGAGRGLAILAVALGVIGIGLTIALRSGLLPELLPPIGPLSSVLG